MLARIKTLVSAHSLPSSSPSSSGIAEITQNTPVMMLLIKMYPSFFDRVDTFERIDQVFGQDESAASFRSIALFGLGGIGKSSIAARYIERKMEEKKYDAVFWVYGGTTASLRQSFTDIALLLKLPGSQPQLHDENLTRVRSWFQTTGKPTINF